MSSQRGRRANAYIFEATRLSSQSVNLDEALDKVFAAPLHDFTATRNAVARELKGADAKAVKAVKKPNLSAWAVNQVAREHADDVASLFDVTDKLRTAQRRVLSGGKAASLREATDQRNKIVAVLTKRAAAILKRSGHGASTQTLAGITDSFVAVASDPEGAERLRKGHLERELEPSSVIDVGGGLTLVESRDDDDEAGETDAAPRDDAAVLKAREALSKARATLKDARDAFKAANTESQHKNRDADEAERKAKLARQEADFAGRAAEARQADLDEAEAAVERAQRVLGELDR
jgi:hypothetical protein